MSNNNITAKGGPGGQTAQPKTKKMKPNETVANKERIYNQWTPEQCSTLVEWFEDPDNYEKWKFAGKANKATGRLNSTAITRAALEREIQQYLTSKGFTRDKTSVVGKIKSLESSWKKAQEELVKQTGSGVDELDERMKITGVREQILRRCPMWDRLNPIYCQRSSMAAPHTSDNMTEVDFETDSVLADDTHDEIPLTPEQLNDFFQDEDVSEYPVYDAQPELSKVGGKTLVMKNNTALTSKASTSLQSSMIRPKRQEKKLTTTADALREASRDRLAFEREKLDMEKQEKQDEKKHRLLELDDREKQSKFGLEKLEKESELIRLKLQLAQAQRGL